MKNSIQSGDLYAGLSLLRLQVFVAVVDHDGFSAAAAFLDLAQPTISFHIKALERLLGTKLLVYRERRVHLTQAGQEVYRVATGMLRDAERLASSARNVAAGAEGRLDLGASMAFELGPFFERIVGPFRARHPRLHLALRFGHSVRLAEAVLARQIDLAYVLNWRLPIGVRYEPLHHAEFTLMVSSSHPLASQHTVTADDIYAAGLITSPIDSQEWPHYEELLRRSGLERYRVGIEIDGVQARLLATQAGLGVMGVFVPPFARDSIGRLLRPVSVGVPPPDAEFGLVSRDEPMREPAIREFADWLRAVAGGLPE